MPTEDIIDQAIGPDSGRIAALRQRRHQATENAQASYDALFVHGDHASISLTERLAIAAYVTALSGPATLASHYQGALSRHAPLIAGAVAAAAEASPATGPFGRYPAGPLSVEDTKGRHFVPPPELAERLGRRLTAGFAHAHLLLYHPRDASPDDLRLLLDAGWTTPAIVTLSQIVAFLSFQARTAAGLSMLAASINVSAPRSLADA